MTDDVGVGCRLLTTVVGVLTLSGVCVGGLALQPRVRIANVSQFPSVAVTQFEPLELTFQVIDSSATDPQWPYDPKPPPGVPAGTGVTVEARFRDPSGKTYSQPAFRSERFVDEIRDGRDWHLPTGEFSWHVRFTPHLPGEWSYSLRARDETGSAETETIRFKVAISANRGFIRVSEADPRYFEFDDGTFFTGLGFELPEFLDDPSTRGGPEYRKLAGFGVDFVRVAVGSLFGSAWAPWIGGRNQYRGYLPVTGLVPLPDPETGEQALVMQLDYEPAGDTGWFDACRMEAADGLESIEPDTDYRLRVEYRSQGVTGPRDRRSPQFGLVAKVGGWHPSCYEPGAGVAVTTYGTNTDRWSYVEGKWHSGKHNFLPRLHLGLENVESGTVYVRSVSLREDRGDGTFGPEMMARSSMAYDRYIFEEQAYAFDKILQYAERSGVFLKVVLGEKNDKVYFKLDDDGTWARSQDNPDGFYGVGRGMNKTRWLQQAFWRYAQARWGYSANIHSWELTNEGDPSSRAHFELADEFGKFMHCRVFGVEPGFGDGDACDLDHPNAHLVTTSFWAGFPAEGFWANPRYPNLDYADVHSYVSSTFAPPEIQERMSGDAALYRIWHSQYLAQTDVEKPIVSGEGGLDAPGNQSESILGLDRDVDGVWLHNYLWAGLDSGGLYALYWWNSHIWQTKYDHRSAYTALAHFVQGLGLQKGGYVDWGGDISHPDLRVVGQKNLRRGLLHLWIQNRQHTWHRVVSNQPVHPVSGEIAVPGFEPDAAFSVEWWDTYVSGGRVVRRQDVVADSTGTLRLRVTSISTDVAVKARRR